MTIKNDKGENAGQYYCPHPVAMQGIFRKISSADSYTIDNDVSKLSANVMEETLLNVPKFAFDVLNQEKVIKSIYRCMSKLLRHLPHVISSNTNMWCDTLNTHDF